jgi:hypothetical protein
MKICLFFEFFEGFFGFRIVFSPTPPKNQNLQQFFDSEKYSKNQDLWFLKN